MKKSLKSWLSVVAISANFFSSNTYQSKINAVKLFLEDSTGSKKEVFNFDITPDNPYFDENGKEIVKIFQNDTEKKAWSDSNQRYTLRKAIEWMVANQIKTKLGSAKDWSKADDNKAKLFKILSIIVTECARILLRARKENSYQSWIDASKNPQDRLDLFWISWMTNYFIYWFTSLYYNPEQVGIDMSLSHAISSTECRPWYYDEPGESLFTANGTLISHLLKPLLWNQADYARYFDKYVSWLIKDEFSRNVQERWLYEKPTDRTMIKVGGFIPSYTYPVVGKKEHVSKEISRDDFLNGDLLNLSYNSKLVFKASDGDTAAPTVQPTVQHSVKHKFLFRNKGNSLKSKSYEIDSDKIYLFKASKTGTPTLEEID